MDRLEDMTRRGFPAFPEMDPSGTVDVAQLEYNLTLAPAERLRRRDDWLDFIKSAQRAFRERHGIDPSNGISRPTSAHFTTSPK